MQNFVYLIGSLRTREAAVVDPAWNVDQILKAAAEDEMIIKSVLVTHTHFDHINGVGAIVQATDAQVFVHKREAGALQLEPRSVTPVEGGDEIVIGGQRLSFLHTPGHTPGSVCFETEDRLVTGDTLFIGGCGRCDLPGGDAEELHKSLSRLHAMKESLAIYPGHNYAPTPSSSIGNENKYNPFLMAPTAQDFLNLIGGVKKRGG